MRFSLAKHLCVALVAAALIATGCNSSSEAAIEPTATPLVFAEPTELPDQTPPTKVPTSTPVPATVEPTVTPTPTEVADDEPDGSNPDGYVVSPLQPEGAPPMLPRSIEEGLPFQYPPGDWHTEFMFQEEIDAFWAALQVGNEEAKLDRAGANELTPLYQGLVDEGLVSDERAAATVQIMTDFPDEYANFDHSEIVDVRVVRSAPTGAMVLVVCHQVAGSTVDRISETRTEGEMGTVERLWVFEPVGASFRFVGFTTRHGDLDVFHECPEIDKPLDLASVGIIES